MRKLNLVDPHWLIIAPYTFYNWFLSYKNSFHSYIYIYKHSTHILYKWMPEIIDINTISCVHISQIFKIIFLVKLASKLTTYIQYKWHVSISPWLMISVILYLHGTSITVWTSYLASRLERQCWLISTSNSMSKYFMTTTTTV